MSTPTERARAELVTPTLLRNWPLPGGGSSKDDRGSVLVMGGARKTPGAALLAGNAALRVGGVTGGSGPAYPCSGRVDRDPTGRCLAGELHPLMTELNP